MEINQNIISTKNYPAPSDFDNNLKILQEKLPPMLDDFQKYYVFYKKNPEYTEYEQSFQNIKTNLQGVFTELFKNNNMLEKNISNLNSDLDLIAKKIEEEKKKNQILQRTFDNIESTDGSSDERLNDYQDIYNFNYMRNFALLSGIFLSSYVISKVFIVPK